MRKTRGLGKHVRTALRPLRTSALFELPIFRTKKSRKGRKGTQSAQRRNAITRLVLLIVFHNEPGYHRSLQFARPL